MTSPAISVVMPVFNAARYLRASIESVLGQTCGDFEFLVYDDGSSDASVEIAKEYQKRDSRLRVYALGHRGYVPCLNDGLRTAVAPLVARMDADDICLPERFLRQVDYLEDHPLCVVVGTDYEAIDEDGEFLIFGRHETDPLRLRAQLHAGELGIICHPSAMMRRVPALAVGAYRVRYESVEDLDLWFRLAQAGHLGNIPEILFRYRHHEESVCHTQSDRQKAVVDEIVSQGRASFGLPPLAATVWPSHLPDQYERRLMWARWALSTGNRRSARKHLQVALSRRPTGATAQALWLATYAPRWLIQLAAHLRRIALKKVRHSGRSSDDVTLPSSQ